MWNKKVTVIPIINGDLGTITKGLVQELEDLEMRVREETIQTIGLVKIGQNTEKSPIDIRSFKLQWKTIIQRWCEKLLKE